ncbi:scamp-domain-containing protein [Auriscalpium vulgare]|uniref:Scamp-domain-containing protein n=1 Tax=Auriscalpium vulgare TaxID=40419 RepID=A0ACB8SD43_9AGAM|nr:scamp-domain-containing protein [Auriscalpium vulgare]
MSNSSDITKNPFASTASLDTNPFDDPFADQASQHQTPQYAHELNASRAADLERRERDLERREQELSQKADHIRTHGRNNWPPFFPLIFHSIQEEIPESSRFLISRLYLLWLVLAGTLVLNFVACIFVLTSGASDGGKDLGASIGLLIVITPLSFLLWYRPIYNGYMKEQSLYYYIYYFFAGWHLLFSLYIFIGIPSTGSAGVIQTVRMYARGSLAAGILCTLATVGWGLQGLGNAFYYKQIWDHGKAAGHSVTKARSELATTGAKAYFTRG